MAVKSRSGDKTNEASPPTTVKLSPKARWSATVRLNAVMRFSNPSSRLFGIT